MSDNGSVTVEVPVDEGQALETPAKKPAAQQQQDDGTRTRKPAADAAADDLKDQLKTLQRRADVAEGSVEEANRRAAELAKENENLKRTAARFKSEADKNSYESITSAMAALKATREQSEEEYATAMERGDFRAAAKAQSRISEAAARYVELEGGKVALEHKLPKPGEEGGDPEPTRAAPTFEDTLKQYTPQTAAWFRKNPQFLTDQAKAQDAQRAHFAAMGENIKPDTPEYFEFVERRLKIGDHDEEPENHDEPTRGREPTPARRERPIPAAAPSRENGGAHRRPGSSPRTITLTAEQQEAARISGLTNEEYAKQLVRIETERQA